MVGKWTAGEAPNQLKLLFGTHVNIVVSCEMLLYCKSEIYDHISIALCLDQSVFILTCHFKIILKAQLLSNIQLDVRQ